MTLAWKNHDWGLETHCRRFAVTRTATGYNLVDRATKDIVRTSTIQCAKAVASIRVGEPIVHHSENHIYA